MSLYGDLPQAKNSTSDSGGASNGWSALDAKHMAPPSLKKPAVPTFKPPPSVLRAAAAAGPGRGGPARGIPITGRTGGRSAPPPPAADGPPAAASPSPAAADGTAAASRVAAAASTPLAAAGSGPLGGVATPGVGLYGSGGGVVVSSAGPISSSIGAGGGSSIFTRHDGRPIEDEYDPLRPNDYEEVVAARERARKAAEAEAERLVKVKEMEAEAERLKKQEEERQRSAAATSSSAAAAAGGGGGAGVMSMEEYERRRAAMGMTGDDAFARRGRMVGPPGGPGAAAAAAGGPGGSMGPPGAEEGGGGGKGMSLAQKLLEKMGWREGEGLGKNRQGISNPLVAQKTNQRAAVIVEAPPAPVRPLQQGAGGGEGADAKRLKGAALNGPPTRVICMRNMVGPGQVDEELEEEVGQELSKYGKVTDVLIFEVTTPGYQEEEAVRIFVQFDRPESATKAAVDLQGRFFAGRSVRVAFFSEDRFTATDLAPKQSEFD